MAPYTRKTSKTNYCKSSEGSEKDTGPRGATKLEALFGAYATASPPVGVAPTEAPGQDDLREDAGRGVPWATGHRAAPQRGWHCERALPAALAHEGP